MAWEWLKILGQWPILKDFLGVIYTTSSIFPYGFDWGYANKDVIMAKKVL